MDNSIAHPGPAETVARLLRVYRSGSTSPSLVETESGELFVMKFRAAGPGGRALLTEFLAAAMLARLGLSVPEARPLWLAPEFPWQIGTDEFDDLVQRSAGWNLGSCFIADARDLVGADLDELPAAFLVRLRAADRLLQNVDRTQANPNLLSDPAGRTWAIDHGACLFLERIVADRKPFSFELPPNHFLAGRRLDGRDPPLDAGGLLERKFGETLSAGIPEAWLSDVPIPRAELARRLTDYVEAFAADSAGTA